MEDDGQGQVLEYQGPESAQKFGEKYKNMQKMKWGNSNIRCFSLTRTPSCLTLSH